MATYEVVVWKEIPAAVEARDDTGVVTRQLSERFQALIDSVAMRDAAESAEAYLEGWSRSEPVERPGPAVEVADAVARELEDRFGEFAARAFRLPSDARPHPWGPRTDP
jgi:cvfA/B/C family virulence factor